MHLCVYELGPFYPRSSNGCKHTKKKHIPIIFVSFYVPQYLEEILFEFRFIQAFKKKY